MADKSFISNCQFCEGFLKPGAKQSNAPWNTILLESTHFVVVPTLGMLVPGWVLIIPKSHYPNMAILPASELEELAEVVARTRHIVQANFETPIIFEHGAAGPAQRAGACIDHAHWHVIPTGHDLLNDLLVISQGERLANFDDLKNRLGLWGSYLLYENQSGEQFAFPAKNVPCQLVRRLVAQKIGKPHSWDWAAFPGLENVKATLSALIERESIANTHDVPHQGRP